MKSPRLLIALVCVAAAVASFGFAFMGGPLGTLAARDQLVSSAASKERSETVVNHGLGEIRVIPSYHNDVSPRLSLIQPAPVQAQIEVEADAIRRIPHDQIDQPDAALQDAAISMQSLSQPNMPGGIISFDGISFPGVNCFCAPPDTAGAVGRTQYVQVANKAFQVFNKNTGSSVLGPTAIGTIWNGFGGVCEFGGFGDPVVIYDRLANRWIISQFASTGGVPVTDQCVAVSATSDAAGSYYRYAYHLGAEFFDYPKLATWPDAYYMSMNVFNSAGTAYLGPQPFAFDRAAMLVGNPAMIITPGITGGPSEETYLPADLDGNMLPPSGAPNPFVEWPNSFPPAHKIFRFHVDFAAPANSTFTFFASVPAAGFTALCLTTIPCIPQPNTSSRLDALGDRLMFRAAYRNFGTHESLVTNYTVDAGGGVAAPRWIELRNVTTGPVSMFQQSTYAPDSTSRWMGSAAMDRQGNLAIGFTASSGNVFPSVRYAGRLVTDPINTLAQGEATLFVGLGSQSGSANRWGDYSALTVDPIDDCTFWYTNEYYPAGVTSFNWRTRIGSFKFAQCTPQTLNVRFTVAACANGNPLSDAFVFVDGNPVGESDANGELRVVLAEGNHSYSVTKPGFTDATANLEIPQGGTLNEPVCLAPSGLATPTPSPTATPIPTPSPPPGPTPTATPVVYVSVSPASANVGSDATFTIIAGLPNQYRRPVTIFYSMSGRARLGLDYTLSGTPGRVTVGIGEMSGTVVLHAIRAGTRNRAVSATMKLIRTSGYKLGSPNKATVSIRP